MNLRVLQDAGLFLSPLSFNSIHMPVRVLELDSVPSVSEDTGDIERRQRRGVGRAEN